MPQPKTTTQMLADAERYERQYRRRQAMKTVLYYGSALLYGCMGGAVALIIEHLAW